MKPRLLDLFCGAGGSAVGYHQAGFEVVGVDIAPQPNYPFEFLQGDALWMLQQWVPDYVQDGRFAFYGWLFDAIHASPPCQAHVKGLRAVNQSLGRRDAHLDLIAETRELLRETGLPYVIENVPGAPLRNPIVLCGSSFGLAVRRHRLFESNVPLMSSPCAHGLQHEAKYWTSWRPNGEKRLAKVVQVYGNAGDSSHWAEAMGIDWMSRAELCEAIPPAYTELVGSYLIEHLNRKAVA